MATMNVSLPDPMKDWDEDQARIGRYADLREYVRDLIRRDQERRTRIDAMQRLVDDGLASGPGDRGFADVLSEARNDARCADARGGSGQNMDVRWP